MRLARKSIWIPCLLGALALAILVFAWRFPKRATIAELREAEAQRVHSEALERIRAASAKRDAILRPIHEAIERGGEPYWSGEYVVEHSLAETRMLVLGVDSYAWLGFTDVGSSDAPPPELWPEGWISEQGRFSVEGDRIQLHPAGERREHLAHECEWKHDELGRHVRIAGDSRWIDASVER